VSRGFRSADVTAELSEQAAADLLERVREEEAAQARHAAERRAAGGYGVCEDCGGTIGAERLQFVPDATRCISCQAARDRHR
jgi:RNA polymerase-binding transcription factor